MRRNQRHRTPYASHMAPSAVHPTLLQAETLLQALRLVLIRAVGGDGGVGVSE